MTGCEAAADVLGLPDHYASCICAIQRMDFYVHNAGVSTHQSFRVIQQPAEQAGSAPTQTLSSRIQDYVYMDIPFEDKMTPYEFAGLLARVPNSSDKRGTERLLVQQIGTSKVGRRSARIRAKSAADAMALSNGI